MENFYNYVLENFTLSDEAKRMLNNLCLYVENSYTDLKGILDEEGIALLDYILSDSIGLDRQEIIENWR